MVEFAFSGVGTNPHFTHPPLGCTLWPPARRSAGPGGSSLRRGRYRWLGWRVYIGLGSDTGGCIRIPAAFNGIVGFKSTARLVPASGRRAAVRHPRPRLRLTRSVCAMPGSWCMRFWPRAASPAARRPLSAWRLAVPNPCVSRWHGCHSGTGLSAHASPAALALVHDIEVIALPETGELGPCERKAPWLFRCRKLRLASARCWHSMADRYDPRVRSRIERGAAMSAADYIPPAAREASVDIENGGAGCRF